VHSRALIVGAALATESWLGSEEGISNAEEAKARDDVVASFAGAIVEKKVDFPSEFDLLRLERARLSDMEQSFRADYDAESALLEAEQNYVQQLESLLGGVSSLVREAEGSASTTEVENAGTKRNESNIQGIPCEDCSMIFRSRETCSSLS